MPRAATAEGPSKLKPSEVAARWGVSTERVLAWIRSGDLRAMDGAARQSPGHRPRYLIDVRALEDFEARRLVGPPANKPDPVPAARTRRRQDPEVFEYFK